MQHNRCDQWHRNCLHLRSVFSVVNVAQYILSLLDHCLYFVSFLLASLVSSNFLTWAWISHLVKIYWVIVYPSLCKLLSEFLNANEYIISCHLISKCCLMRNSIAFLVLKKISDFSTYFKLATCHFRRILNCTICQS